MRNPKPKAKMKTKNQNSKKSDKKHKPTQQNPHPQKPKPQNIFRVCVRVCVNPEQIAEDVGTTSAFLLIHESPPLSVLRTKNT